MRACETCGTTSARASRFASGVPCAPAVERRASASEDENRRGGVARSDHCSERPARRQAWAAWPQMMGLAALVAATRPLDNRLTVAYREHARAVRARSTRSWPSRLRREPGRARAPRAHAHGRLRARALARGRALPPPAAHDRARRRAADGNQEQKPRSWCRSRAGCRTRAPSSRRLRATLTHAPHAGQNRARAPRRSRCEPRRRPPGCGSRSAASSGCSRCGS